MWDAEVAVDDVIEHGFMGETGFGLRVLQGDGVLPCDKLIP